MYYILAVITVVPVISLFGYIFDSERRPRLIENPLIIIYFLIAFTYFYVFWFKPYIFDDILQINFGAQVVFYGLIAFAPMFHNELPN